MSFFTRRSYIRAVSYMLAIFGILTAFAIINTNEKREYKTKLEASYQQSLGELSGCLDTVNTDLTKTLYSNSSKELYALSRDLFAQCQSAKNAVSRLPVSQMELANVYKFLSQAMRYRRAKALRPHSTKHFSPCLSMPKNSAIQQTIWLKNHRQAPL